MRWNENYIIHRSHNIYIKIKNKKFQELYMIDNTDPSSTIHAPYHYIYAHSIRF